MQKLVSQTKPKRKTLVNIYILEELTKKETKIINTETVIKGDTVAPPFLSNKLSMHI